MNATPGFAAGVRAVLADAAVVYGGTPHEPTVAAIARRLDEPLRVAVAGKVKAGKSTLLNALVGEELAPTDASECTRVVWWFRDGITYRVTLHPRAGPSRPLRFSRDGGALDVDLAGTPPDDVERLDVEWPTQALRTVTLIDTPGIASATPELGQAAQQFLVPEDERAAPADAVIYLMRHLHAADVRFLESFHDDEHAQATPVNAIAVLSRADETGAGRLDAMESAERVAERYRRDRRLGRLCQAVVPVAGLLAQGAATLREGDYRLLRQLHALPEAELADLLLSVDRLSLQPSSVPAEARAVLVRRLGLFGVRLALRLIGEGRGESAPALASALYAASGIGALTGLLAAQFTERRDLLKGRAGLLALAGLVQHHPVPGSERIDAEVERIQASAHELAEVRLLNAIRTGESGLRDSEATDAERLLGSRGGDLRSRLDLDTNADDSTVRAALGQALARWQRRAEAPLASAQAVEAARVVVRTCEALVASLPSETGPGGRSQQAFTGPTNEDGGPVTGPGGRSQQAFTGPTNEDGGPVTGAGQ